MEPEPLPTGALAPADSTSIARKLSVAASRSLPLDEFYLKGPIPFTVPKKIEDVDAQFFTNLLRAQNLLAPDNEVTDLDSKVIGADKGFTSTVMLAKLTYKSPPLPDTSPDKLVVKIMGADLRIKGLIDSYIVHHVIFPNEIRFFAENKDASCPAHYPTNYFAHSRGTDHFMVMEDLSDDAICGDGAAGGASYDQCVQVMLYLAKLHGHFWGKRHEAKSPSSVQNLFAGSDLNIYPLLLKKVMPTGFKVFAKAFPHIMEKIGADTINVMSKVRKEARSTAHHNKHAHRLPPQKWKAIARIYRSEPMTLCHGDMKLDNIFFKKSDGSVIAVDWGVSGWGNPMADLSYFFGRSVDSEDRRKWWDDLLDIYLNELVKVNPSLKSTYTKEKMLQDLSYTSLVPFFTVCGTLKGLADDVNNGTGPFAPEGQRTKDDQIKRHWMDQSLTRVAEMINDLNIKESLESTLLKVDPSLPVIPCCCFWTMWGNR